MAPSAFPQHRLLSSVAGPAPTTISFATAATPILSLSHDPRLSPSHSSRQFVASLPPIIGSPLSTPVPSISHHSHSESDQSGDPIHPPAMPPRDRLSPVANHRNIPNPIWTSTPPTPLPSSLTHKSSSTDTRAPSNSMSQYKVAKRKPSQPHVMLSKPLPPIPTVSHPTHPRTDNSHITISCSDHHKDTLPHRLRPVFHIGADVPEKEDHDHPDDVHDESCPHRSITSAPLLSSNGNLSNEDSKRCHALSELLATELAYLIDLRILVSAYLRSLPVLRSRNAPTHTHGSSSNLSLAHFSRTPSILGISHLNSSQRAQSSYQYINTAKPASTSQSTDGHGPSPVMVHSVPPTKEKDKNVPSYLFSPADLDTVTRNVDQILEFHENLVHELRTAVSQFGFSMQLNGGHMLDPWNRSGNLQRAIDAVSTIFLEHASSFDCYQSFCTGHLEALELVRKAQQRYPSEWEAFEQQCADIAAELLTEASAQPYGMVPDNHYGSPVAADVPLMPSKKRRRSLSSLDASAPTWPQPHVLPGVNLKSTNSSGSESGHGEKSAGNRRPRLAFVDYLIKPIQRICKYPLLFDHLQSTAIPDRYWQDQEVAHHAIHVMRAVASSVNEARGRQELSIKSNLIISRICQGISMSAANSSRPFQQPLAPEFLSSLGPCQTVGSLDVIHYDRSSLGRSNTVTAKYLGAFLFSGGFLVLAKVAKGKVYEPRHWFSLREFELVDSNTDDALLQSWFRLSFKGHTLELAASCRREKDVWMEAIHDAVSEKPTWVGVAPTSLQADARADFILDVPVEMTSPLPTIQSIPELDSDADFSATGEIPVTFSLTEISHTRRTNNRVDYAPKADMASRRSSVTSFRAYQTPSAEASAFHLVRSNAAAREQVDRDLQDVLSDKCSSARQKAFNLEEDLFEAQNVTRSFSRSSSGLTMASAMSVAAKNKLTKRESVLVPRRKSFLDNGSNSPSDLDAFGLTLHPLIKPAGKCRPSKKQPTIISIAKSTSSDCDDGVNEQFLESPSPMSHCSSGSATVPVTPMNLHAPLTATLPAVGDGVTGPEFIGIRQEGCGPKRSRSMIDNVRGLFVPRCGSPNSGLVRESSVRSGSSNSSLLKWWSKESIRQRSRSAPDVPGNELPTSKSHCSPIFADRPHSQLDLKCVRSISPRGHARHSSIEFEMGYAGPKGVRGFFSGRSNRSVVSWPSGARLQNQDRECVRDGVGIAPPKVQRNSSLLRRLTPIDT
ncbi:hypothetical protein V8B97DRAFT_1863669 [Scleroderma yunnanense]